MSNWDSPLFFEGTVPIFSTQVSIIVMNLPIKDAFQDLILDEK